jgi:uncharacterized BrkB/YihY/UPF0761 family membrane protein
MPNVLTLAADKSKQFAENVWKNPRTIIAFIIVVGCFSFLFVLLYKTIPDANKSIIDIAAGAVLTTLATVANFYFGSSKDKSDQDKAERDNVAKNPPSTPAA